jgi:OmpA family protein
MKNLFRLLLTTFLFTSATAYADIYIGGGAYMTVLDEEISTHNVDDKDIAPAFFLGWRPIELIGVELGYYDFGEFEGGTQKEASIKGSATTLAGLLSLELGPVGAYVKGGMADYDFDIEHPTSSSSDSTTDPFGGVGVTIDLADKIYVYAEYMRFDSDIDVDVAGAGLRFSF